MTYKIKQVEIRYLANGALIMWNLNQAILNLKKYLTSPITMNTWLRPQLVTVISINQLKFFYESIWKFSCLWIVIHTKSFEKYFKYVSNTQTHTRKEKKNKKENKIKI